MSKLWAMSNKGLSRGTIKRAEWLSIYKGIKTWFWLPKRNFKTKGLQLKFWKKNIPLCARARNTLILWDGFWKTQWREMGDPWSKPLCNPVPWPDPSYWLWHCCLLWFSKSYWNWSQEELISLGFQCRILLKLSSMSCILWTFLIQIFIGTSVRSGMVLFCLILFQMN